MHPLLVAVEMILTRLAGSTYAFSRLRFHHHKPRKWVRGTVESNDTKPTLGRIAETTASDVLGWWADLAARPTGSAASTIPLRDLVCLDRQVQVRCVGFFATKRGEMLLGTLAAFTSQTIENVYQVGSKLDNDCYHDSYKRIAHAATVVGGHILPPWNDRNRFCRIWGSIIGKDGVWTQFPRPYRGFGAPGALAMVGWSQIIRGPQIWSGALLPGAVLQGWAKADFYPAVRDGAKPAGLLGHSFVFIGYERAGGKITGLRVADNGFHGSEIVHMKRWPVLVGANTISA